MDEVSTKTFRLSFDVKRQPEAVQSWWTDLPDDYHAKDPRENPFRIRTLARRSDGADLESWWRGPFGRTRKAIEHLRVLGKGHFTYDIAMGAVQVHDDFRLVPTPAGSRMDVQTTLRPTTFPARLFLPLFVPAMKRQFRKTWRDALDVCEKEVPA